MYSYHDTMRAEINEYINDEINLEEYKGNREELEEKLNDDLWICDAITGNASGSYTMNRAKAREYVTEDGFDHLREAISDFGITAEEIGKRFIDEDWEWLDVTIRCYLLGQIINEVLDDLEEQNEI